MSEISVDTLRVIRKHGVRVISINEPFDDTPTRRLLEAMIESLDEFYPANLGEEVMRGVKESVSRRFFVSGVVPYGYRKIKVKDGNKERVKLEPDGHKSEVVKLIFNEFIKGKGIRELAKYLKGSGIASPKGKGWINTTIYHMLTNEIYTGTSAWGRHSKNPKITPVRGENAWEALVSRQDFEKVGRLLKERTPVVTHPRRTSSRYLLSGLAHCGIFPLASRTCEKTGRSAPGKGRAGKHILRWTDSPYKPGIH